MAALVHRNSRYFNYQFGNNNHSHRLQMPSNETHFVNGKYCRRTVGDSYESQDQPELMGGIAILNTVSYFKTVEALRQ